MKKFKVHVIYRNFYYVNGELRLYNNKFNATMIRNNGTEVLKYIFDTYSKISYMRARQGSMFGSQLIIDEFSIEYTGSYE